MINTTTQSDLFLPLLYANHKLKKLSSTYLIIYHLIYSYFILSYFILSYFTLSYLILSYLILSYLILSYTILVTYRNLSSGVRESECSACLPGMYCATQGLSEPTGLCDQGGSICLSVCLFICLSVCLSACLSVCCYRLLSVCLCICVSV